jgi:hypothetical protein
MKYESPTTYHSKDMANMANVKTNRQTDRPKTICPRSFDTRHKKGTVGILTWEDNLTHSQWKIG